MKKLFIVTGELSGDIHASAVVKQLRELDKENDIHVEAIGGSNLKELGIKLFVDHSKMSAVGVNLKIILDHISLGKRLVDYLKNEYKPDLVLLIDYGGFNLSISKILKKAGIKVFYFIPPQIWASRKWRINTVKKNIDKVMTIFPFEKAMYDEKGIDSQYVGHPLVSQIPPKADRGAFFEKYGLDKNKKLVSIFPGSRTFELQNLMSTFLSAAKIISEKNSDVQFVISQAASIKDETFHKFFKDSTIQIIKNDNQALLSVSDVLMLASGTVALEATLYETPMIVSYNAPSILFFIYKLVRCIKRVCLPNIILDKDIVPELIQKDSKPQIIAEKIHNLLNDETQREAMVSDLSKVREILSSKDSALEVSKIIYNNI